MAEQLYYHGSKLEPTSVEQEFRNIYKYVGGGGGGLNYSLEEQVVGTWIDGRPVYALTFFVSSFPNSTIQSVGSIPDMTVALNITGYAKNGTTIIPINTAAPLGGAFWVRQIATSIEVYNTENMTAYSGYLTVHYLK